MDNQFKREGGNNLGLNIRQHTVSVWTYVNDHCAEFLNPFYSPISHRLQPDCDMASIKFWKDHFL